MKKGYCEKVKQIQLYWNEVYGHTDSFEMDEASYQVFILDVHDIVQRFDANHSG